MKFYRKYLIVLAIVLFSFGACQDKDEHGHAHDEHGAHDDHHGAHMESHTSWGARTQVYIEHEPWRPQVASAMTVHVTELLSHRPLTGLTFTMRWRAGQEQVSEVMPVMQEVSGGIYVVPVEGLAGGVDQLELVISDGMGEVDVHRIEGVEVGEQHHEEGHEEEEGSIALLLEEQWKMPFAVSRAERRPIRPHIAAFAHLTLPDSRRAEINAPREGRVLAPRALGELPSVGQEVEVGDVLLEMTTSSVGSADPAALDLAVEQASLRLGAAQKEVDRIEPLVAQGVVADKRLAAARLERDVASAALRSARRQRESLSGSQKLDRRKDVIALPSPIAGRLGEVHVAPGSWVKQGDHLASVIDDGELWLDVDVPEAYVQQIEEVSGVWFEPAKGEVLELGRDALISVGPTLHTGRRTLPVRFRVKRPEGVRLYAGMTMKARVMTEQAREAVAIPHEAVMTQDGKQVVYVQKSGERFERRQVRTGVRDGPWIEIEQGVEPGEWVVSQGVYAVRLASAQSSEDIGHGHAH